MRDVLAAAPNGSIPSQSHAHSKWEFGVRGDSQAAPFTLQSELRPLLAELHDALQSHHTPTVALLNDVRQDIRSLQDWLAKMPISPAARAPNGQTETPKATQLDHQAMFFDPTTATQLDHHAMSFEDTVSSELAVMSAVLSQCSRAHRSSRPRASIDFTSDMERQNSSELPYMPRSLAGESCRDLPHTFSSSTARHPGPRSSTDSGYLVPGDGRSSRAVGQTSTVSSSSSPQLGKSNFDIFHADTEQLGVHCDRSHTLDFKHLDAPSLWKVESWQDLPGQLVTREALFRIYSCLVIVLNALFSGCVESQAVSDSLHGRPRWQELYIVIESTLLVLMVFELGARRLIEGSKFWTRMLRWNVSDAFVTVACTAQIILQLGTGGEYRAFNFLRFLRLARLAHMMPKLHTLRAFISMFWTSLPVFCWTLTAMLFLMYTYALFISQRMSATIQSFSIQGDGHSATLEDTWQCQFYDSYEAWEADIRDLYLDVPTAMATLFGSISGGLDWGEAARPCLCTQWGAVMYVGFILFVFVMLFCFSNIFLSIIIESARDVFQMDREVVIRNQISVEQAQGARLYWIFSEADTNRDGRLSREKLTAALSNKAVTAHLSSLGVNAAEVLGVFNLLPKDENGGVELKQFIQKIFILRGPSRNVDLLALIYASRKSSKDLCRRLERIERTLFSDTVVEPPLPAVRQEQHSESFMETEIRRVLRRTDL